MNKQANHFYFNNILKPHLALFNNIFWNLSTPWKYPKTKFQVDNLNFKKSCLVWCRPIDVDCVWQLVGYRIRVGLTANRCYSRGSRSSYFVHIVWNDGSTSWKEESSFTYHSPDYRLSGLLPTYLARVNCLLLKYKICYESLITFSGKRRQWLELSSR